jgi:hypothetical protein
VPAPAITRAYDVALAGCAPGAAAGAAASLKKVTYANEWDAPRAVVFTSSQPRLVAVRGARVELPARGRALLRFAVAAAPAGTASDVLLYVSDESGAVEETLLLRLTYT